MNLPRYLRARTGARDGPLGGTVGAALVVVVAAVVTVAPASAGTAMVVLVLAAGTVGAALSDPAWALALLVLTSFLRTALQAIAVPVPIPLLLLAVALAGLGLAVARGRLATPTLGGIEIGMALYLAWNVVSWAAPHDLEPLGPNSVAVFVASGIAFPFGMFVIGRVAGGSERLIAVALWSVLGVTAYSTLLAIVQFHGPAALVWPSYVLDSSWHGRAVGIFDQPVTNGVLLTVGIAVGLHLATTATSRAARVSAAVVSVATVYALYLTHTRAVWLAAVVVVVLALGVRELRRGAATVLVCLAVVVAAGWSTLTTATRAAGGVTSTSEVDDRLNMIATAWWALGEHPWVGWGVARFQHLDLSYHQQWSPEIDWRRGLGIASHENELGIAAELGLVGLALWLAVLVLLVRGVVRAVRAGSATARPTGLLAAAALVTLVVVGTTVDLRYLDFAEGLTLLLVGLAVGATDARVRALAAARSAGPPVVAMVPA